MARVKCIIEEIELEGDYGNDIDSVSATCTRCGLVTESYGTEEVSVNRCLALLNEECPNGEDNFYVVGLQSPPIRIVDLEETSINAQKETYTH